MSNQLPCSDPNCRLRDGTEQHWCSEGRYHRDEGPAVVWKNGSKWWFWKGLHHRAHGPAVESVNGAQIWYWYGLRHREVGPNPSVIIPGTEPEYWYCGRKFEIGTTLTLDQLKRGQTLLSKFALVTIRHPYVSKVKNNIDGNCEDLECPHHGLEFGSRKHWCNQGYLHRLDGPAVINPDGTSEYWVDGIYCVSNTILTSRRDAFTKRNNIKMRIRTRSVDPEIKKALAEEKKNLKANVHEPCKEAACHLHQKSHQDHWCRDGVYHREDGPAIITEDGERWFYNGKLHRLDGPAWKEDGEEAYYVDGLLYHTDHGMYDQAVADYLSQKKNSPVNTINPSNFVNNIAHKVIVTDGWGNKFESNDKGILVQTEGKINMKADPLEVNVESLTPPQKKLKYMVKSDLISTGYRVAATQLTIAVKKSLLAMLKDKGMTSKKLTTMKELLDSDVGNAIISMLLGYGLTYAPQISEDERAVKLADEFRVSGMAVAGNLVAETALQYFLPVINDTVKNLPSLTEAVKPKPRVRVKTAKAKSRVSESKQKELESDSDVEEEEETPQKLRQVK